MAQSLQLQKHVPIRGTITCLTGLRIGGTKEDIEIGGMDNPVIRHPVTREPYVPGSSLKGKLRSVLEYRYCSDQIQARGEPCGCARESCLVCRLFGPHKNVRHLLGPTRLLVRDAHLIDKGDGRDWVEAKSENMIDRRTGVATNPRPTERVAAGTQFSFEMSVRVFEGDDPAEMLATIREGLTLIENDYLGAAGSRGYGKVKFTFTEPEEWREPE